MNIIYFGTDNNSKLVLEDLVNSENKVVLVITTEDSVRTRGNKKTPSVVKDYCIKNNINCIDKIPGHKKLETFNPDIIIVASFGKIIPMEILEMPKYGALNLHPSLLPKYRGPSPVHTAIKNGEEDFGVSIIRLSEDIDAGPIVCQNIYPGSSIVLDTEDLTKKLFTLGSKIILNILSNPEVIKNAKEQDHSLSTMTKKIRKKDGHINWNSSTSEVHDHIRAFNDGNNSAYSLLDGKRIKIKKIFMVSPISPWIALRKSRYIKPGSICDAWGSLVVATKEWFVGVSKLQVEGKKVISGEEFINHRKNLLTKEKIHKELYDSSNLGGTLS